MELTLHQSDRKKTATLEVAEAVFAAEYNEALIHQVLTSFMSAARAGTRAQKSRAEVRGGGRKPWRQKGTGRARAGTSRSPIWRGGGVTFAAKAHNHSKKVNKKMYRSAMRSILSELARQDRLSCIDEFSLKEPKTKLALARLSSLGLSEVLIVTDELTENLYLATRNIPRVDIIGTGELNPYVLISRKNVLLTRPAVGKVEAWLA